jgi:hypothetical protein
MRPGAVLVAATGVGAALARWLGPDAAALLRCLENGGSAGPTFEALLERGCAAVTLACVAWLWWCCLLTAADAWAGAPGRVRATCPAGVRRLILGACGALLVAPAAAPVTAPLVAPYAAAAPVWPGQDRTPRGPALDGLPLPARPPTPARRHRPAPAPAPPSPAGAVVVVRPGDSLWSIARAMLPPTASGAAVQRRVRALYLANRSLIGEDPDLIRPAQRLRVPLGNQETR